MKYLCIDYGTTKMGLAVSDPEGRMAFPRGVLRKKTNDQVLETVGKLIAEESIEALVVGLPLSMSGEETLTSRQARNFGNRVAAAFRVPVSFADERLTSAEARERLKEGGIKRGRMKDVLDAHAAVLILETHLASLERGA